MTEDSCPRVSSSESDLSTAKKRKKRKWDQPDDSLVCARVPVPEVFPTANGGSLSRITFPTVSSASLAIPFPTSSATPVQVVQVPLQQHAASIIQKLVQPKIQDELIAREIVINDADPAIRYKLTKRQTQEEIQKSTGAVVITRGKYRPPYAPNDGERPLYLHISAATNLETTAERINSVDHAAAMVEEMLKQATLSSGVEVGHLLSTSVFLGFEPDPSMDIISRIRGPNVYGAVPPPPMLQAGVHSLTNAFSSTASPGESGVPSQGSPSQSIGMLNTGICRAKVSPACYPQELTSRTSYNGYGGIYPQVTPLQQVALALRQSTAPVTATVSPATTAASTYPQKEVPYLAKDKRSQKRKFQELPVGVKGAANPNQVFSLTFYESLQADTAGPLYLAFNNIQGTEFSKPRALTSHVISAVQERKSFVKPSSNEMPPPPPKFNSTPKLHEDNNGMQKSKSEAVTGRKQYNPCFRDYCFKAFHIFVCFTIFTMEFPLFFQITLHVY